MKKIKNLHLLFHKLYFRDMGIVEGKYKSTANGMEEAHKVLFGTKHYSQDTVPCPFGDGECSKSCNPGNISCPYGVFRVELYTTYPGLLAGLGYPHEGYEEDAAIDTGFSFDYTTGQPYLPGSSVKGVLRSVFTKKPEAIVQICNGLFSAETGYKPLQNEQVAELLHNIFEEGDVFFDAVVVESRNAMLDGDTVTPHGRDVTQNPIPVQYVLSHPLHPYKNKNLKHMHLDLP